MYYPYIQGKQFDLMAVRELNPAIYKKVLPIIDPVQTEGNPLAGYRVLNKNRVPFILITNPTSHLTSSRAVKRVLVDDILDGNDSYISGFSISSTTSPDSLRRFLANHSRKKIAIIHKESPKEAKAIRDILNESDQIAHNIISTHLNAGYIASIRDAGDNNAQLKDGFVKAGSNSKYAVKTVEDFCTIHKTYATDGYDGFGDYTIIGEAFISTGFSPLAIAIHITDQSKDKKKIIVNHFVSDSNADRKNPAGKYAEAAQKMSDYIDATPHFIPTAGSDSLMEKFIAEEFPGLGSVKKHCMKHHIELMSKV